MNYAIEIGLRCLDIHTKFPRDLFSCSKVNRVKCTHTEEDYLISIILFIKE
jgi:hypothetical protein